MESYFRKFKSLFRFKDDSRSLKTKKNIILLIILNGFNFISVLLLVPLTLDYLGAEQYGIWLTLSSILLWLSYLDFGIGNGLRNKLAVALANNEIEKARIYISTAYAVFTFGIAAAYVLFVGLYEFIDWISILNAPEYLAPQINKLIFYVITFFVIQFVLKLIISINNADQRPALNGLLSAVSNLLILGFIYFIDKTTEGSIVLVGAGSTLIPAVIFLAASFILFSTLHKNISPSFKFIDLKYSKELIGLGVKFFIMQAAGLIVFTTDNLIITHIFGPEEVTIYNIAYKYFYLFPLVFNVFLTPLWSAYTEAYAKQDIQWIKNAVKKITLIWIILSILAIVMLLLSDFIYMIWVGDEVSIPIHLSISMAIFIIIFNWTNIFTYFLNGVGKIDLQFYNAIFIAVINIPLSILLADNLELKSTGVIIATVISISIGAVLSPIQFKKIISGKAKGIWAK
jgi:O-antigen/teichoic acid export membrane protein